ncbi:MAG TPA: hypothetical protein VMS14_03165, partial [Ilumatobacteraceae bacterium]|nr:hypothetical protein [Ilumatobacteraceae bacterium]
MTDFAPAGDSTRTSTLPVLSVPAVLLPGTVVTLTLAGDDVRAAVEAARHGDGRVVLFDSAGEAGGIGVIATVPDTALLPTGQQAAILRIERRARVL